MSGEADNKRPRFHTAMMWTSVAFSSLSSPMVRSTSGVSWNREVGDFECPYIADHMALRMAGIDSAGTALAQLLMQRHRESATPSS
jgi:hypothetical protein